MIESFDKDLELAIDRKIVEKQHRLVVDSLREGIGVKLEDEAELSAREYLQDLVGRLELLETKCYNPVATGNALKKMFDKLSMGPTPHEENVAEIIREIRRGKNVC